MQRTRTIRRLGASLALVLGGAVGAADAAPPGDLTLTEVATGLPRPLAARHAGDGSGRLFIVSQKGPILIYEPGVGVLGTPFLDLTGISETVSSSSSEYGLLGLAFHPDYASNGIFFVSYTVGPVNRKSHIVRYEVSEGNADVADPTSATLLLQVDQPASNHNGGNILFGPDGYLYIGFGDGGAQQDFYDTAQEVDELLGKFLRIDVNGSSPGAGACGEVANYAIPADNPFVGVAGVCPEIWSIGWRNPWRFSFDRARGDLIAGDVGQVTREEVNLEPAGLGGRNYGWSCREGSLVQNFQPCLAMPLVGPLLEYPRGGGVCSVTGGYRYRGARVSGLGGTYIYGDYCSGEIFFAELTAAGALASNVEWGDIGDGLASFGEDEAGEVYVLDIGGAFTDDGRLLRFESASSIFTDGFESGDVTAWGGDER